MFDNKKEGKLLPTSQKNSANVQLWVFTTPDFELYLTFINVSGDTERFLNVRKC